ncbi:unnamed protein product [Rotaria magnacalcarata]|nr:unnamed protein product [Rotaria magnacalcarata]
MYDELRMTVINGIGKLINYSHSVDKYTHFIAYTYYSRTKYLVDEVFKPSKKLTLPKPDTFACHMIVLVNWGINATVILRLPPNDTYTEAIDYVLQKICWSLGKGQNSLKLSKEDENCLTKILHMEVFSNISELDKIDSILDFHSVIQSVKSDSSLYPIEHFYATNNAHPTKFIELRYDNVFMIKSYFVQLSMKFKTTIPDVLIDDEDLLENGFKYQNALNQIVRDGDDEEALEHNFFISRIGQLQSVLMTIYTKNSIHDGVLINGENIPQPLVLTPPTQQEYEDIMDILLLGETGVGKSTFINGFVNYLKYNKLEEAEKNPIVLIPVSFFITTDNDFEEHLVKFEGKYGISDEDHKKIGQSVTQHCKSYVLTLTDNETW